MMIIGCDFHTRYQQIAMMDDATGELVERRLDHERRVAEAFAFDFSGAPPLWFVNGGDLILVFFARDCPACRIFSTASIACIAPDAALAWPFGDLKVKPVINDQATRAIRAQREPRNRCWNLRTPSCETPIFRSQSAQILIGPTGIRNVGNLQETKDGDAV